MFDLCDEVRWKIALSNVDSKARADLRRHRMEFQEGDLVIVHLQPERFPKEKHHKLYSICVGPYKVLKKIGSNAYVLELTENFKIS